MKLFGVRVRRPSSQLMLAAVVFVLVAALVVAIRCTSRSAGSSLAVRDSEAACATFGLNLLWPRLGVFMLSAGIAGLGGAIYGMQLGRSRPSNFDLVAGLPIFVLVVVGGAGLVGGALFAGIGLYGFLPLTSALGPTIDKINTVTPGLIGIGLGRNPSGVVPLMSEGVAPAPQRPAGARRDDRRRWSASTCSAASTCTPTGRS